MRVIFINAHPDDAEFTCASTKKQAVDLRWEVYEILMTSDEYGTARDDFKGERIRKIRKTEMLEAAKVYGVDSDGKPKINLIWFGEIDGYLRFNREVFSKLKKIVDQIKPHVIIGPDSFYSLDLHPDHKHTGWLIYFLVKSLSPESRPVLLLYHSFQTNFFVKIQNMKIQIEGWARHQSQTSPLQNKILWKFRKIFYFLRRRKTGPAIAEGFRRVNFEEGENNLSKIRHRMLYHFVAKNFSGMIRRWLPSPRELGLL
ncbi:MAG: PIG-L family deacetylase [Promethearchaeota archaeon]|nr:MAG: PIG-L family deacetylase [Candidatus Lokiarchaeota archaeon]